MKVSKFEYIFVDYENKEEKKHVDELLKKLGYEISHYFYNEDGGCYQCIARKKIEVENEFRGLDKYK